VPQAYAPKAAAIDAPTMAGHPISTPSKRSSAPPPAAAAPAPVAALAAPMPAAVTIAYLRTWKCDVLGIIIKMFDMIITLNATVYVGLPFLEQSWLVLLLLRPWG